jgi:hypothetical protein
VGCGIGGLGGHRWSGWGRRRRICGLFPRCRWIGRCISVFVVSKREIGRVFGKGMYLVDGNDAVCGLQGLCCCLGGHCCSFECAIDSLLLGNSREDDV